MAQFVKTFYQELNNKKRTIRHCEDVCFTGDNLSDMIGVYLTVDGQPYTGGGTVSGTVINSRGQTIPITTGAISGNLVTVTLEQGALAVPGLIGVYVKLTTGTTVTTVLAAKFTVEQTETDTTIDPGTVIASVNALITRINTAVESIPADYSELLAGVAPSFSSSTAYTAGQYVWYPGLVDNVGALYRFTADHAAGSWTGTDAVSVPLAGDLGTQVTDLKSAMSQIAELYPINLFDGSVTYRYYLNASGVPTSYGSSAYTDDIPVSEGSYTIKYTQSSGASSYNLRIHGYADGEWQSQIFASEIPANTTGEVSKTFTVPSGVDTVKVSFYYWDKVSDVFVGIPDNNYTAVDYVAREANTESASFEKYAKSIIGMNKLNGLPYIDGYINASGGISGPGAETKEITYDYIEVNPGDKFKLYLKMKGTFWAAICYWNESKTTFVTRVTYSTAVQVGDYYIYETEVTVPANAYQMRLSMRTYGDSDASVTDIGIVQNLGQVEEALKESANLYEESTAVKGYIYTGGSINSQTNYKEWTSDYIEVTAGEKICIQLWATPTSTYKLGVIVAWYNSTKTYTDRQTYEAASHDDTYFKYIFTVPSGSYYIRISGRMFLDGLMMVTRGEFPLAYDLSWKDVKTGLDRIDSASSLANADKLALQSLNLFVRETATVGFINTDGSVAPETTYREMTSDFISVGDAAEVTAQTWSDTAHNLAMRCVFYNSSKEKISYTDQTSTSVTYLSKTFTCPTNTAYIRIASRYLKTDAHMMVNLGTVPMQYIMSWQDINAKFTALNQGGSYGLSNPLLRPAFPRVAMHRGFMSQAPENTIPAFTLAGQAGAWGIETDVWETTDGYFVISHDDDVSRMTDGTGKISEMTYAQTQECTIDAGSNIEQYPDQKMPLLEDYLKICRRYGCVACVEIKGITNYANFINTIKAYGMEGSTVLASYWDESMFTTIRGLTAMPIMIVATGSFETTVDYATRFPDIWIDMIDTYITKANLDLAHAANIPVAGWTYETESGIENATEIGMDIAISGTVAKLT